MTAPKGKMPVEPTREQIHGGTYIAARYYDELRAYCAGVEADAKRWRGGYFLYFPEYCGHDDSAPDGSGWYHQNITEPRWFKTPNEAMDAAIAQANLDFDDAAIDAERGKISATLIT